ncbi:MAG: hypothetical protein JWP36_2153 [Paucimonas sp.]|nr:hypothetical protein [Paucimonas sp.]
MRKLLSALALGFVYTAALAQPIPNNLYRDDDTTVVAGPKRAEVKGPSFDQGAFNRAYARKKKPKVAVLWNREFTDVLEQSQARQIKIETDGHALTTRNDSGYGRSVRTQDSRSTVITSQDTRETQQRRSGPSDRVELQMRSAFIQTLSSAGLRLVDRNVTMRVAATRKKEGSTDSQRLEAESLSRAAEILMEVLCTPDTSAPLGWSIFLSAKRLGDGVILTEGYLEGTPPAPGEKRYVADPRGDFREVMETKVLTPRTLGQQAAEQALRQLTEALQR